jgi:serine/threonine protein kinase
MAPGKSRLSNQTTVTMKTGRRSPAPALLLDPGSIVRDEFSRRDYRIVSLLGHGGFGAVYQSVRLSHARRSSYACVLKVTLDALTWHREAYFGHLLRHVPDVVRVHDSFAWVPREADRTPLYCLVSEHIAHGDLGGYLKRNPTPWTEPRARREIIRLLRAVTRIHESGAVHRDITPGNVFVAAKGVLKLGDFGIALHRAGRRDVAADAFAPRFAPSAIQSGAKSWRQADDVHQIGQLYAALLSGVGSRKITATEVKRLACSAHTKSVLQRCIGERRKCFASASEMLAAMEARHPAAQKKIRVRSLDGKNLVFTGELTIPRAQAKKLARKAGAIVEARVGHATDVLVVGRQSPHWKAEAKGQKLLDADREAERGHHIALLTETRFLALAGRRPCSQDPAAQRPRE